MRNVHGTRFPVITRPYRGTSNLRGLGINPVDTGVQAAAAAANFIPGVGPIISAVLSVGDAIFGGGDPTALSILINNIVQLRSQVAQARTAMGARDDFVIPSGFNAANKDQWRSFVDSIVTEAIGQPEPSIQSNRREDYYATIKALQTELQGVSGQAHDQALTSNIITQVQAALSQNQPPANPIVYLVQNPQDDTGTVPYAGAVSPDNSALWIIGGAVGIITLLAVTRD